MGAFIGLFIIGYIQDAQLSRLENVYLIGSFGATCVLIYGAIDSPLAQPRNLIGGHIISAFIGVSIVKICPDIIYLTAPLAVALSIIAMQWTKTLHPPGGATALIAVSGGPTITALGYSYILAPVLSGVIILLVVALVFNNITNYRQYPKTIKRYPIISKLIFWKQLR
jgi:CBS domain-containing membrane protein